MSTPVPKSKPTDELVRATLAGRHRLASWMRSREMHEEAAGLDTLTVRSLAAFTDRDPRDVARVLKRLVKRNEVHCVVRRAYRRRSVLLFRWRQE